ncbi:MAG: NADH-quinone oxidoreductase subunit A [Deltaproteobacteria bacterium CG_4_9_14_3_um_filter_63_12]|nr:MAG: NADH-quinone oxidoreductase subunit A [Deltaproteobacteria bacterium CG_4_9_14_3_um_filter_63_12]
MYEQYYPIALVFGFAGALVTFIVLLSTFVGPTKVNRGKYKTFECGSDPVHDVRQRFSVKFYVVAIIFILFDIETVFLYPWAVLYKEFSMAGLAAMMFVEMLLFLLVLGVGLVYVWKRGALEWD